MRKLIEKVSEKASTVINCQKDKNELLKSLEKQQAEIDKIKKAVKKHEKRFTEV